MTAQPSIYQRVLGDRFDALAKEVREFHSLQGAHKLQGAVTTSPPQNWVGRLLGLSLGTPQQAVAGCLTFDLTASSNAETWTRHFPGKSMSSVLTLREGKLQEKLGAAVLTFELRAGRDGALTMVLSRLTFWHVPCPRWLRPNILAREYGEAGALHFHVEARVPLIGLVTRYTGYVCLPTSVSG